MDSIWYQDLKVENSFNKETKYDIAIVGGGVAGISCAYWLAKYGKKVLVIDKNKIGQGASGRNAGFLTGGSIGYFYYLFKTFGEEEALKKWSFTTNNVQLFKSELDLNECDFIQKGTISLYEKEDEINELLEAAYLLQENEFDVEITNEYFNKTGIHIKTDGMYDPVKVLKMVYNKIKDKVDFLVEEEVISVASNSLKTKNYEVSADKIVLATNFALTQFLDLPITPQRSQIAYYECDNSKIDDLNFFIPQNRIYFRKYDKGIIIGGLRTLDAQIENTDVIALNSKIQSALKVQCEELFGESKLIHAWAGIMGFTHDEQPLLGEKNNIYYLGGFSGHGNGYAFTMARNLVEDYLN
jgi:gamma-glutamylputrescine oxidase